MRTQPPLLCLSGAFWLDSMAKKSVKLDIDNGVQPTLLIKEFRESRVEYQEHTFKCFTEHVPQDLQGRRERAN